MSGEVLILGLIVALPVVAVAAATALLPSMGVSAQSTPAMHHGIVIQNARPCRCENTKDCHLSEKLTLSTYHIRTG